MLREGEILPTMIKIPPTDVKPLKSYFQGLLLPKDKGNPMRRPHEVVTRIVLNPAGSSDGTDYGVPAFEAVGALKPETAAALKKYGESFVGVAPVAEPLAVDDGDVF